MDISFLVSPTEDVHIVDEPPEDVATKSAASPTTKNTSSFSADDDYDEDVKDPNLIHENPVFVLPKSTRHGWSKEEKELLTRLRSVEKARWTDVAQALPGRSPASCRSQWHYQGQMNKETKQREKERAEKERSRSEAAKKEIASRTEADWENYEWSEELKDEFALAYERLKRQMWHPIALEMNLPWKTVEAWHWAMGQSEIAARAAAVAAGQAMASPHQDSSDAPISSPKGVSSSSFPVKSDLLLEQTESNYLPPPSSP